MLGSHKKCSNCHGNSFRRIKLNRTIQCQTCKLVVEERCMSDLAEYHATTQTEEIHCVVTPDFLHTHLVDDIPNDPYCTPGFISAFRMLAPLREPVYAASARTLSGSLAEMERLIGDALFAGYVGYNGRAPGAAKKEDHTDPVDKNKSGGDARHTLVAYFEIVELASLLSVDRETTTLAIRIFRHTASNTSLRNRNVESLATAAFVSAAERRWHDFQQWAKQNRDLADRMQSGADIDPAQLCSEWPSAPKRLTVEEIAAAASLDPSEVLRYLKVVNVALRKQRPENSSSITTHMPTFCRRLDLPTKTRNLAISIAEKAMQNNICSRRNPISISAAAIYLACQLDGIRKTQTEICRATTLTEVTLRKVFKELNREHASLIPDWHVEGDKEAAHSVANADGTQTDFKTADTNMSEELSMDAAAVNHDSLLLNNASQDASLTMDVGALVPPPLPPGFGKTAKTPQDVIIPKVPQPPPLPPATAASVPQMENTLLSMMNNPAMQAFANAMTMLPQLMVPPPPPPPPPLPPKDENSKVVGSGSTQTTGMETSNDTEKKNESGSDKEGMNNNNNNNNMMTGMHSMMSMMQMMQAYQTVQQQNSSATTPAAPLQALQMMAALMGQAQNANRVGSTSDAKTHAAAEAANNSTSGQLANADSAANLDK